MSAILKTLMDLEGKHQVHIIYTKEVTPSKDFKGIKVEKTVDMIADVGIKYQETEYFKKRQALIESGERAPVKEKKPWYVKDSNGITATANTDGRKILIAYPVSANTDWYINGEKTDKDEAGMYLTESAKKPSECPMITIDIDKITYVDVVS